MTVVERYPLDGGAGSQAVEADGARVGLLVAVPERDAAGPFPLRTSASRSGARTTVCAICDRPRTDAAAARDTEHAPCDRVTARMESHLAAGRQPANQHLGIVPW